MTKIIGCFLVPMMMVLMTLAYFGLPYAERPTDRWFEHDLALRAQLVSDFVQDDVKNALLAGDSERIKQLFARITENKRLLAMGYCDPQAGLLYQSGSFPAGFSCGNDAISKPVFESQQGDNNAVFVAKFPMQTLGNYSGTLVVLNDLSFIEHRHSGERKALFIFFLVVFLASACVAALIAHMTLRGWLNAVRLLLQREEGARAASKKIPKELKPLMFDLYRLLRHRRHNRQTVNPARIAWLPDSLRQVLRVELPEEEIIAVSNREPYVHNDEGGKIVLQTPVGGLVSALEPVMRACKGTWIAQGSGSADRATVDRHDRLAVPPDNPFYQLRRLWLNEDEEKGFYYGFSNEGLWPLCCHLAFTRPVFREEDWRQYQAVNRKFADAVATEAKKKSPVVLVQDYHFALLPALIHDRLPQAIVATFWHVPWPSVEAFSICPWREELLRGLLGSDIIGFHTQFYCNNFFDTVDRFLECRVDRERATITFGGRTVLVQPYPISIEWPPTAIENLPPASVCRETVFRQLGLPSHIKLGVGVERFDYTKGIMDRFYAVARFFRQHPSWIGKFTFVQIASPTRGKLPRYQEVQEETIKVAKAINAELGTDTWKPIILIPEHYTQTRVFELFRASDLCIVSSLHDGMNLVAKEFVAARDDENGVLILSTFAGASEELVEALIVNPHDVKGMADSIQRALQMKTKEQKQRMVLLRDVVRDHNVYWWAGQILLDVARIRKSSMVSAITNNSGKYYGRIRGLARSAFMKLREQINKDKAA